MKDIFAFIPAKLGSKRLPSKNIMKLHDKELLGYQVEAAINSKLFGSGDVICSTESVKVKEIAQKFGAEVPYLRSEELAKDPNGVSEVLLDLLSKFPRFKEYKSVMILLPTSPMTKPAQLVASYNQYLDSECDCLMSITETDYNCYRGAVTDNCSVIRPLFPDSFVKNSSELRPTFRINGAICIIDVQSFLESETYHLEEVEGFVMEKKDSIDIDTLEDFLYADFLMTYRKSITI